MSERRSKSNVQLIKTLSSFMPKLRMVHAQALSRQEGTDKPVIGGTSQFPRKKHQNDAVVCKETIKEM